MTRRLIRILVSIINITEKRGVTVKPHSALLQGELIERITIRYEVDDVQGFWSSKVLDR